MEKTLVEKTNWFVQRRLGINHVEADQKDFMPVDLDEAYRVQHEVLTQLGWCVGGWKLGGTNTGTRSKFSCTNAYYGPIEQRKIILSDTEQRFHWNLPNSLRGEAEISVRLASTVDRLSELQSLEDVFEYIDLVAPSIECPYSTLTDIHSDSLTGLVADLCGSGYLILGKRLAIEPAMLTRNRVIEMRQQDGRTEIGNTENIIGFPLQALFEFLNLAAENSLDLRAGQWVATGGCTSCVELLLGAPITLSFQGVKACQITPYRTIEQLE